MLFDPVLMFYEGQPVFHVHVSARACSVYRDYVHIAPLQVVYEYHVEVQQAASFSMMCTAV